MNQLFRDKGVQTQPYSGLWYFCLSLILELQGILPFALKAVPIYANSGPYHPMTAKLPDYLGEKSRMPSLTPGSLLTNGAREVNRRCLGLILSKCAGTVESWTIFSSAHPHEVWSMYSRSVLSHATQCPIYCRG